MGSSCPNPFVGDVVPPRRRTLWVQLMDFANVNVMRNFRNREGFDGRRKV